MMNKTVTSILIISCTLFTVLAYSYGRPVWVPLSQKITGKRSVADVMASYGNDARTRLQPYFDASEVNYPPEKVTLLAIKDQARLELWAETKSGPRWIHTYPIQALSGIAGPKLREGDKQVPEGFYRIEGLNPNSAYHLSMKLNYPNTFDLQHAANEGRNQPGSNIFIHGKAASIGCLAMGDSAIEELFVLAVDTGVSNIQVAIAPSDPRHKKLIAPSTPHWIADLYQQLNRHFGLYHD